MRELPFLLNGAKGNLFVFVAHLFSQLSVFVFGDFFSSFLYNATHSIAPPSCDSFLLLILSRIVNR